MLSVNSVWQERASEQRNFHVNPARPENFKRETLELEFTASSAPPDFSFIPHPPHATSVPLESISMNLPVPLHLASSATEENTFSLVLLYAKTVRQGGFSPLNLSLLQLVSGV